MKFEKKLRLYIAASGEASAWPHIDYKRLKDCIKAAAAASGPSADLVAAQSSLVDAFDARQHAELAFRRILLACVGEVDFCFSSNLESLRAQLDAIPFPLSSGSVDLLLGSLVTLNRYAVLNYLAVLKIVKKHDKVVGIVPFRTEALAALAASSCMKTLLSSFFIETEQRLFRLKEDVHGDGRMKCAGSESDLLSIPQDADGAPLQLDDAIKAILGSLSAHYHPRLALSPTTATTSAAPPVPWRAVLNFWVTYVGYACLLACRKPFSGAKPALVDEMHFTTAFLGVIDASMLSFYSAGSLLVGPCADHLG